MNRRFDQLDVFSRQPLMGNPLAVVHDAQGLPDETLAAFARWTNLSETTFLLPPTQPQADYRVRIFTPMGELPFAGHPTLGSCHAWLAAGGQPRRGDAVVQECGVGLVRVRVQAPMSPPMQPRLRRDIADTADGMLTGAAASRLAFAAPPLRRSGALEEPLLVRIAAGIGVARGDIVQHQWVDNGPGWCAVMLASAAQVLAVRPDWPALAGLRLGLVGAQPPGSDTHFEVRALLGDGRFEDPVTGSLNASLAQWLIGAGCAPPAYTAAQGTVLGRAGRVHLQQDGGEVWVGGDVVGRISGQVSL